MVQKKRSEIDMLRDEFNEREPLTELLIRIDERVKSMDDRLQKLEAALISPTEYRELVQKVNNLWDWRNKVLGSAALAGALTSVVFKIGEMLMK